VDPLGVAGGEAGCAAAALGTRSPPVSEVRLLASERSILGEDEDRLAAAVRVVDRDPRATSVLRFPVDRDALAFRGAEARAVEIAQQVLGRPRHAAAGYAVDVP